MISANERPADLIQIAARGIETRPHSPPNLGRAESVRFQAFGDVPNALWPFSVTASAHNITARLLV